MGRFTQHSPLFTRPPLAGHTMSSFTLARMTEVLAEAVKEERACANHRLEAAACLLELRGKPRAPRCRHVTAGWIAHGITLRGTAI